MKIMKTIKTGILIFFLGSIFGSCQNAGQTENSIAGKWTIENITPDDTTDNKGIQLLTLIMAMDGVDHLEFSANGEYEVLNEKDSVLTTSEYEFSENDSTLIIIENGEEKTMKIVSRSENEMRLKSMDGVTMTLKRKE